MSDPIHALLWAAFLAVMAVAAVHDLWSFRIPNVLPATLAVLFIVALTVAPAPTAWALRLGLGVVAFAVGAAAFRWRLMGGGDVKLLAAAVLWIDPHLLPAYLGLMALIGGGLALGILAARRALALARTSPQDAALPRLFRRGEPVPYGVAIAGAALAMAGSLSLLGGVKV